MRKARNGLGIASSAVAFLAATPERGSQTRLGPTALDAWVNQAQAPRERRCDARCWRRGARDRDSPRSAPSCECPTGPGTAGDQIQERAGSACESRQLRSRRVPQDRVRPRDHPGDRTGSAFAGAVAPMHRIGRALSRAVRLVGAVATGAGRWVCPAGSGLASGRSASSSERRRATGRSRFAPVQQRGAMPGGDSCRR